MKTKLARTKLTAYSIKRISRCTILILGFIFVGFLVRSDNPCLRKDFQIVKKLTQLHKDFNYSKNKVDNEVNLAKLV